MPGTFRLLQVVRVVRDLSHGQIRKGAVGTVIEVFDLPHAGYEVEFVDRHGRTTAQVAVMADDLEPARETADSALHLTPFEKAVLVVLANAANPFGWYNIEVRLSNMDVSERPHLPPVLTRLRDLGLVMETHHEEEPTLRYALTSAGRAAAGVA